MRWTLVVLIFSICFSGCAISEQNTPIPTSSVVSAPIAEGNTYNIVTVRDDGATVSYRGKVADVTDESVVLDGATQTVAVTESPNIPLIGKMFKNSGIGMQELTGEVRVSRNEIIESSPVQIR